MAIDIPTLADFRAEFPELPSTQVSDAKVNLVLEAAQDYHNETKRGILLCAAHLATGDGLVEILQSTQGPVSARFKEFDGGTFWATTFYGRMFREFEKRLPPRMSVVY